jgi:hypothetical protein
MPFSRANLLLRRSSLHSSLHHRRRRKQSLGCRIKPTNTHFQNETLAKLFSPYTIMIPRPTMCFHTTVLLPVLLWAVATTKTGPTSVLGFLAPIPTARGNDIALSMVAMDIQTGEQDATSRMTKRTREVRTKRWWSFSIERMYFYRNDKSHFFPTSRTATIGSRH